MIRTIYELLVLVLMASAVAVPVHLHLIAVDRTERMRMWLNRHTPEGARRQPLPEARIVRRRR